MKPILFSTAMVQALIALRKRMTRREVSKNNSECSSARWEGLDFDKAYKDGIGQPNEYLLVPHKHMYTMHRVFARIEAGNVLWVRESFKSRYVKGCLNEYRLHYPSVHPWLYCADGSVETGYGSWKPSIHMPRAAARIFLKVTAVRVERLQDISEADAIAEGVEQNRDGSWYDYLSPDRLWQDDAKASFISLWISINCEQSWSDNPWVWVYEFERVENV